MTAIVIIIVQGFIIVALMLMRWSLRQAQTARRQSYPAVASLKQGWVFAGTKGAVRLAMMIALLVASTTVFAQAQDSEGAAHRVVILNAADPYLPAFLALDRSLREAITRAEHGAPTELYAETLDMFRFPQTLLAEDVVALLRKKYRDLKVDVVVAAGSIAFDFAQRYRAEIWPGAAIVFHSVPATALKGRSLDPRTIGVPVQLEFERTLDLALRLRPATRRLVVVAGTAEPDRGHLSLAQAILARYAGRLDVQYLVGLTLAETVAAVRALPSDAVVLYLTMFRDGDGVPLVPRDVLTRVAAVSPAPVFGMFETYLGYGIVAGSIASYGEQGRRAGELVVKVLNGEDPSIIGVQTPATSHCIADWQQLRRWGIAESLLPADCEIRFKEVTAWDRYYWQILTALAVILAQTTLIIALMLNRWRLRQAQTALQNEYGRRSQAETTAANLRRRLARFSKEHSLGAMATAISHEINQPLIAIQNYAQAVKRRLQHNVDDKPKFIELFEKIEEQAERAGAITQRVRSLVGASDMQLLPVPLCPLVEEVIRMMEPETEYRGCCIRCEPANNPPTVLADSLQVQLVLVNLLQNSMRSICSNERYDKQMSVGVDLINDWEVQVSVMDQGHGVPPDRVADIFEPLYSGASGGMSMGLAISQAIIDAHRGRLWYEPNPAGGAIFRFTLQRVRS
ncbi:MAG: sensor histidine kinase [Candidatus Contendobacter sp.]|nr:sensor histidine kinase [Candidatus Contendobacter sp.]